MAKKYSELLGQWLVESGYTHCFFVAGGGIMHLLDGFRSRFRCIPVVHEVSAGISAEHYNECSTDGTRAFALVTTGPGLTNVVTAIAGCYVEHRELLVIAGQVKSTDLLTYPERQRGVQEIDGKGVCSQITVESACLRSPVGRDEFLRLVGLAQGPHPGPVLIEVCLDVQGARVDEAELGLSQSIGARVPTSIQPTTEDVESIVRELNQARRPVILLGGLTTRETSSASLDALERAGVPVATTTGALDRVPSTSSVWAGRCGTWGGQRAANLIVAQSDVLLVLGAQLDLQQTGFRFELFAPGAKLIHVFPSQVELDRTGPPAAIKILASPDSVLEQVSQKLDWVDGEGWLVYVRNVLSKVPTLEPENRARQEFVNSFEFFRNLSLASQASDILALCSSGGTFTGALQNYQVKKGQIATTSAAHASMGYGVATAIGASFAQPGRRVILTEGEGGFSQNMQELAVIARHSLPVKFFLMVNQGYASIRATQKKFFKGAYLGCDPETGLGFPDWTLLLRSFGIPVSTLGTEETSVGRLTELLSQSQGPQAWIVNVDPDQPNWPSVYTILREDGSMQSSPLYDMLPKLSEVLLAEVGRYLPVGTN